MNSTTDRIDPTTGINIDQAIRDGDNAALTRVEIAQYETMDQNDWYVAESLRIARRRLNRYIRRQAGK